MTDPRELNGDEFDKLRNSLIGDSIREIEMFCSPVWKKSRTDLNKWHNRTLKTLQEIVASDGILISERESGKIVELLEDVSQILSDLHNRYPKVSNKWEWLVTELSMATYVETLLGSNIEFTDIPRAMFTFDNTGRPTSQGAHLIIDVWQGTVDFFDSLDTNSLKNRNLRVTAEAVQNRKGDPSGENGALKKARDRTVKKWKKLRHIPNSATLTVLIGDDDTWVTV